MMLCLRSYVQCLDSGVRLVWAESQELSGKKDGSLGNKVIFLEERMDLGVTGTIDDIARSVDKK